MFSRYIHDFCTIMCACHTVTAERNPDGSTSYQAASPDESALVAAAKEIGYEFVHRGRDLVVLRVGGVERTLKVHAINEFTSERKRMSMLVRDTAGGPYTLLCKGADDAIFERLSERFTSEDKAIESETNDHLTYFGSSG